MLVPVKNGHEVVARQLLERGAEVAAKNRKGETVLHEAARTGIRQWRCYCWKRAPDVTTMHEKGEMALHVAVPNGNEEGDVTAAGERRRCRREERAGRDGAPHSGYERVQGDGAAAAARE